jgi:hypothetical protein
VRVSFQMGEGRINRSSSISSDNAHTAAGVRQGCQDFNVSAVEVDFGHRSNETRCGLFIRDTVLFGVEYQ